MGAAGRARRASDGPVDAAADRALPRRRRGAVPRLRLLAKIRGAGMHAADGFQDLGGGSADEAADQMTGAVAVVDLGQAAVHVDMLATRASDDVSQSQGVGYLLRGRGE